mmetsp:Transcript_42288/g.132472  ORF Transcript_42288/g.132472 Transcript_42288/m.132472 type:complete len:341 (-) Transcript_42288:118-1140(-)
MPTKKRTHARRPRRGPRGVTPKARLAGTEPEPPVKIMHRGWGSSNGVGRCGKTCGEGAVLTTPPPRARGRNGPSMYLAQEAHELGHGDALAFDGLVRQKLLDVLLLHLGVDVGQHLTELSLLHVARHLGVHGALHVHDHLAGAAERAVVLAAVTQEALAKRGFAGAAVHRRCGARAHREAADRGAAQGRPGKTEGHHGERERQGSRGGVFLVLRLRRALSKALWWLALLATTTTTLRSVRSGCSVKARRRRDRVVRQRAPLRSSAQPLHPPPRRAEAERSAQLKKNGPGRSGLVRTAPLASSSSSPPGPPETCVVVRFVFASGGPLGPTPGREALRVKNP